MNSNFKQDHFTFYRFKGKQKLRMKIAKIIPHDHLSINVKMLGELGARYKF